MTLPDNERAALAKLLAALPPEERDGLIEPYVKARTSRVIVEPEGAGRFAALRTAYLAICDGESVAAMLLNELEFQTGCARNDRVKRGETLDAPIWIRLTRQDMYTALLGIASEKVCIKAMKWLTDTGFVEAGQTRSADRAWHYRLDTAFVQTAIDWWHAAYTHVVDSDPMNPSGQNDSMQAADLPDASSQIDSMQAADLPDASSQNDHMILKESFKESLGEESLESSSDAGAQARDDDDEPFNPIPELRLLSKTEFNPSDVRTIPPPETLSPLPPSPVVLEGNAGLLLELYQEFIGVPSAAEARMLEAAAACYEAAEIQAAFLKTVGRTIRPEALWAYVLNTLEGMRQVREMQTQRAAEAQRLIAAQAERMYMPSFDDGPPPFEADAVIADRWMAAYHQLEMQLDRPTFFTWLRDMYLTAVEGNTFVFSVRNVYAQVECQFRLYRNIHRVLADSLDRPRDQLELRFEARGGTS